MIFVPLPPLCEDQLYLQGRQTAKECAFFCVRRVAKTCLKVISQPATCTSRTSSTLKPSATALQPSFSDNLPRTCSICAPTYVAEKPQVTPIKRDSAPAGTSAIARACSKSRTELRMLSSAETSEERLLHLQSSENLVYD